MKMTGMFEWADEPIGGSGDVVDAKDDLESSVEVFELIQKTYFMWQDHV